MQSIGNTPCNIVIPSRHGQTYSDMDTLWRERAATSPNETSWGWGGGGYISGIYDVCCAPKMSGPTLRRCRLQDQIHGSPGYSRLLQAERKEGRRPCMRSLETLEGERVVDDHNRPWQPAALENLLMKRLNVHVVVIWINVIFIFTFGVYDYMGSHGAFLCPKVLFKKY